MTHHHHARGAGVDRSRRTFVTGIAMSAAAAAMGWRPETAVAGHASALRPATLTGSDIELTIGRAQVNFTGTPRTALTINGTLPGSTLRWREGDEVRLRVHNTLDEDTSIHWHGIVLPANMDGVPGLSFHGIPPGGHYDYRFTVRQHGTYWYHSHSGFQEPLGVYGPIVVEPRAQEPLRVDREHVIVLSDWSDEAPPRIWAKLKKQSHYYNFRQRTLTTFLQDVRRQGLGSTLDNRRMWGQMRMSAGDLADVTGHTYTYLMNGMPPAANWTALFARGERVRLRLVNASSMTYFDLRIPGLTMTVVAADGQPVHPVSVEEIRMAVAETYDVIIEPSDATAYTIFAQALDRTGYAVGTLATQPGLRAPVPALDARPVLTMADMGHAPAEVVDHSAMGHDMSAMTGAEAGSAPVAPVDPHAGHDMSTVGGSQTHPASERGNPLVDMQATNPTSRLDDPGIGLRDNGRRVLTYADLRSTFPDPDGREPSRTIELHLTGHMARYVWSFNGIKASDAEPVTLTYGERVRLVLVNDTMMTHPVHLHGMWSDLEDEAGAFLVRKHTINMPPGSRRAFRVTADALGRWALHCHLLLHMDAGMFREVRVREITS